MNRLPQRASLVAQTIAILRDAILAGQWTRWLPGELELAKRLQVSRVTLRAALAELEQSKLIRTSQGRRREIIRKRNKPSAASTNRTAALLSPHPLLQLPTSTIFWVDGLREILDADGYTLHIHESAAAYRRAPAHALDELAKRLRPAVWILYRSTPEIQHWFSKHQRAAVIAGSRHAGVQLPAVDVDYAATCRHAAGRFASAGTQRVAIIRPDSKLAGDLAGVAAFRELAPKAVEALHDRTVRGICRSLEQLFASPTPPDGLFVFQCDHLLTVLGWLNQHGLQVPRDVAVVCRDDEPFLGSVIPVPTRYSIKATAFARKLSNVVRTILANTAAPPSEHLIVPTFIRGQTL